MLGEEQRKSILSIREALDEYLSRLDSAKGITDTVMVNSWNITELSMCSGNLKLIDSKRKEAVSHAAELIEGLHKQIEELNHEPRKYSRKHWTH